MNGCLENMNIFISAFQTVTVILKFSNLEFALMRIDMAMFNNSQM